MASASGPSTWRSAQERSLGLPVRRETGKSRSCGRSPASSPRHLETIRMDGVEVRPQGAGSGTRSRDHAAQRRTCSRVVVPRPRSACQRHPRGPEEICPPRLREPSGRVSTPPPTSYDSSMSVRRRSSSPSASCPVAISRRSRWPDRSLAMLTFCWRRSRHRASTSGAGSRSTRCCGRDRVTGCRYSFAPPMPSNSLGSAIGSSSCRVARSSVR